MTIRATEAKAVAVTLMSAGAGSLGSITTAAAGVVAAGTLSGRWDQFASRCRKGAARRARQTGTDR